MKDRPEFVSVAELAAARDQVSVAIQEADEARQHLLRTGHLLGTLSLATALVDFNSDPAGNAIADGTPLDVQQPYKALGVNFSIVGPRNGASNVLATKCALAASAPNVIALDPEGSGATSEQWGTIRATFDTAALSVSILAMSRGAEFPDGTPSVPYLRAFDAKGNQIAQALHPAISASPFGGRGPWVQLIAASGFAKIASVQFSCPAPDDSERFLAFFDELSIAV